VGVAGVEGRGMLSKGSPVNPGELVISSKFARGFRALEVEPGPGNLEGGVPGSECALIEVSRRQGKPEAAVTDNPAVLRTHGTCEGGEPQGSGDGRPRYPLEGRGEQMDGATQ
jgi:hypothetical protein